MSADYIDIAEYWFKSNLEHILKMHKGEWVVIFEGQPVGYYPDYETAYKEGLKATKSERIVIRRVTREDTSPTELSVNVSLGLLNAEPSLPSSHPTRPSGT